MAVVRKTRTISGVNVVIYADKIGSFTVSAHLNGKRKRFTRWNLADAEEKFQELVDQLNAEIKISPRQMIEFKLCLSMLDGKCSVLEAVEYYLSRHSCTKTILEAFRDFRVTKEERLTAESLVDFDQTAKPFLQIFGDRRLSDINVKEFDRFLRRFPNLTTRGKRRKFLINFSTWCVRKGILPDGLTEAEKTENPTPKPKTLEFLTVDNLEKILRFCEEKYPELVGLLAIRAFAGIRLAEVLRMTEANFRNSQIELPCEITKTRKSRTLPIFPNLKEWIDRYGLHQPTLIPKQFVVKIAKIAKRADAELPRNGFRRGFVTHAMAKYNDAPLVSSWAGHSISELERSYKGITTPDQAQSWFQIRPLPGIHSQVVP